MHRQFQTDDVRNQNHTPSPSGSGLAREPSYSEVRTPYRNLMSLAQHHFEEQRVTIEHMEEQAVQTVSRSA